MSIVLFLRYSTSNNGVVLKHWVTGHSRPLIVAPCSW